MNRFGLIGCFLFYSFFGLAQPDSTLRKKILFVATNVDMLDTAKNGTFLVEIVFPFEYFKRHGYAIDIVTPLGKPVPIYWMVQLSEKLLRLKGNEDFQNSISHTIRPAQVNSKNYVAVYIPGGYGQFFDVCNNDSIQRIISTVYSNKGVLGACGHGVASLCNVKSTQGVYLVKNKLMTCFPLNFERKKMLVSNYGKLLPFNMQEVLKMRGANVIVCSEPDFIVNACRQIVDVENRLITGAFADDCLWMAEQMLFLLQAKH